MGHSKKASTVLLLVDWINPFDFEGGSELKRHAESCVDSAVKLAESCGRSGIPVIIVNDNYGQWSSDHRLICERAMEPQFQGREIARKLLDLDHDHFVLKPRHSAFHHTVLDLLLEHLGAENLILSGLASNICILFTANDAHLRHYKLWIPGNCCAAEEDQDHRYALRHFRKVLSCSVDDFEGSLECEQMFGDRR